MADSPFQVTGVASGISWDEIITKSIEAARAPATTWQSTIDTLEYKQTLYNQLSSAFLKLRGTLTTLRLTSTFKSKLAELTVRNAGQYVGTQAKAADAASVIKATVSANAKIAQYKIDVEQVANAQKQYSNTQFTDIDTALGLSGDLTVKVGVQESVISVTAADTIRTITQKLAAARDKNDDKLQLNVSFVDNRLVIESAVSGNGKGDGLSGVIATNFISYDYPSPGTSVRPPYYTQIPLPEGGGDLPPQLLTLKSITKGVTVYYHEGTDFGYNPLNGLITWVDQATDPTHRPVEGDSLMFEYGITKTITNPASGGTVDITPQSGVSYAGTEIVTVTDSSGTPLILGTDYTYTLTPSPPSFTWINPLTGDYTVTVTQLDSASAPLDYVSNSNGFSFSETPSSGILDVLKLNASDVTTIAAQDAILYLDGMRVTRATNVIEDLITDVKLELVGAIGDVTMNVTQDAQKAIDAVQAYADAYNEVITWINEKLDEKYTSSSVAADDDYLQDILAASKGETVFGTLHGDQLLWSIKNQMRNSLANPIAMNARALVTRSFANTLTPLGIDAEINLYAGGLASRIKILPTYSLSRIRDLVASALVETSKNGTTPIGSTMDLEVSIANGQLVINYNSSLPLANQKTENIVRNHDTTTIGLAGSANYDILSFTPSENAPVNGKFTVQVGDYGTDAAGNPIVPTFYQEGADFNVVTRYTTPASPALPYFESFIEWKPGRIADNTQYKVTYDYNSAAVGYSVVSDTNNSLSTLRFSIDSSQSQLSTFGLVTTADDFGKSGLLEFDTEKLFAAIAGNANNTSNVLTEYFKEMDTYINSLVSSTASLIGGTTYTTGRIANAVQSLELQINDLNTRISKLEAQLAARQTSMYKQYSDMEVAIQTLNAQLSSMTQYFASTTSTS